MNSGTHPSCSNWLRTDRRLQRLRDAEGSATHRIAVAVDVRALPQGFSDSANVVAGSGFA
jgi:hypothetical protein